MHSVSVFSLAAILTLSLAFEARSEVKREAFARNDDGEEIEAFTLSNSQGLAAKVITWGATLISVRTPDRQRRVAEVTLGFDEPQRYLKPHPFFGSVAGRYANRIGRGKFTLDGKAYSLAVNNGPNHLHGGSRGFDKRNWKAEVVEPDAVRLTYVSPDGEEGYPGTLTASVIYRLTEKDELRLEYSAVTDKATVLNLTNHVYWNLSGETDVRGHELQINADQYTEADKDCLPTGKMQKVKGTPLDFSKAKPVGRDLEAMKDEPGGGYDNNYIIATPSEGGLAIAAILRDPKSGRALKVSTDQPGVQLYTGNHLKGVVGHGGIAYAKHAGLCLETQHFPDSPNQPAFPTTVLRPGSTFRSTTVFAFSTK